MFENFHELFAEVTRQHDLQLMAERAMQAAAADRDSEDGQRYAQLVERLSQRLAMAPDEVAFRIEMLAMGAPS